MASRTFRPLFLCTLLAVACGGPETMDDAYDTTSDALDPDVDTGRLIVKFKGSATGSQKAASHAAKGAKLHHKLAFGSEVVTVPAASTRSILARYKSDATVQSVEIDRVTYPVGDVPVTTNDPSLSSQWQHGAIDSALAWAEGADTSQVLIAICDSGVAADHPDLAANLRMDLCYNSMNLSRGDCEPVHPHGTAVAGSAAAIGNNATGIAGVAFNAQIIPIRVTNSFSAGSSVSAMADCITYAADQGADIINLSYSTWGGGSVFQAVKDAATYAEAKGATLFIASGNSGTNVITWDDPENIVYVGALGMNGAVTSWSCWGNYVDLIAPGEQVFTTLSNVSCSDLNANGVAEAGECSNTAHYYGGANGTSFASPTAAGAGAYLKALRPAATPAQIRRALSFSAIDLGNPGEDVYYGRGKLNVHAAAHDLMELMDNTAPVTTIVAPAAATFTLNAGSTFDFAATAVDPQQGDLSASIAWSMPEGNVVTGPSFSRTFPATGTFTFTATVTDAFGLSSTDTVTVNVTSTAPVTAPSNLVGTAVRTAVSLTWADTTNFETGFRVERAKRERNGAWGTFSTRGTLGINATSFNETAQRGTWGYRVVAFNGGNSATSAVVSVTVK